MITVLLVDDCEVDRNRLLRVLDAEPDLRVVASAGNAKRAVELAVKERPDVVAMDWAMPGADGLVATREIMETLARPVVLMSEDWGQDDFDGVARAYEAGAVAGVRKPVDETHKDFAVVCAEFVRTLRASAGVPVVRRWRRENGRLLPPGSSSASLGTSPALEKLERRRKPIRVVAIGASTGGPPVLETILSRLPADFPAPVFIVQHIADGFVNGLVEWLDGVTELNVQVATVGGLAIPGNVYIAPTRVHLAIDGRARVVLDGAEPERSQRPAVSYLFRSVARAYGPESVSVLLTGMGADGAVELKALRDQGAVTVAQEESTCTVFGMPGEAIKIGAAQHVLTPAEIGEFLCIVCGVAAADARESTVPCGNELTSIERR